MEHKVKESDLDSNVVGRGFSNPVHTIGLEDGTVAHTDENGVTAETNELNPDELMSGLDNPQIANIMEQFLPEDMKNLTPEEIEERINKTLSEAKTSPAFIIFTHSPEAILIPLFIAS